MEASTSQFNPKYCVEGNPDIVGIGVRVSVYIQVFALYVVRLDAIVTGQLSPSKKRTVDSLTATSLMTSLALLFTTFLLSPLARERDEVSTAAGHRYHQGLVVYLSWMCASWPSRRRPATWNRRLLRMVDICIANRALRAVAINYLQRDDDKKLRLNWRLALLAGLNITIMMIVAIQLCFSISHVDPPECQSFKLVFVVWEVTPWVWSPGFVSTAGPIAAAVSIIVAAVIFLVKESMAQRQYEDDDGNRRDAGAGTMTPRRLLMKVLRAILLVLSIENTISRNTTLKFVSPAESHWGFGQIVALILALQAAASAVEAIVKMLLLFCRSLGHSDNAKRSLFLIFPIVCARLPTRNPTRVGEYMGLVIHGVRVCRPHEQGLPR